MKRNYIIRILYPLIHLAYCLLLMAQNIMQIGLNDGAIDLYPRDMLYFARDLYARNDLLNALTSDAPRYLTLLFIIGLFILCRFKQPKNIYRELTIGHLTALIIGIICMAIMPFTALYLTQIIQYAVFSYTACVIAHIVKNIIPNEQTQPLKLSTILWFTVPYTLLHTVIFARNVIFPLDAPNYLLDIFRLDRSIFSETVPSYLVTISIWGMLIFTLFTAKKYGYKNIFKLIGIMTVSATIVPLILSFFIGVPFHIPSLYVICSVPTMFPIINTVYSSFPIWCGIQMLLVSLIPVLPELKKEI